MLQQQNHHHHHHRLKSWLWDQPLKNAALKIHHDLLAGDRSLSLDLSRSPSPAPSFPDLTAPLSDELLLRILSAVPEPFRSPASLVSRRWLRLVGRLRRSLTLLEWSSLDLVPARFPDLTDLDLVPASFAAPSSPSGVLLTRGPASLPLDPRADPPVGDVHFLPSDAIDRGLQFLARGCPNLRKLSLAAPAASESGLMVVAAECSTLQELELHRCTDHALRPISAFANLQILRLVASVDGLYRGGSGVTDVGLTILAHGCKRLVKLELGGCEGSYDGISAIGRCCQMLEELTVSDHRMDGGWLAAMSFCSNLKTLKLQSCRRIDTDPGIEEHLGTCPTIESLQIERCQLRDKRSLTALFTVCEAAREIMFQNCWGLDNDMFSVVSNCRRIKLLSLEGCTKLTTGGLESVILSWKDLQSLVVVSCNNIRDDEVSPALAGFFFILKELKWRPNSKSDLVVGLAETGIGKKGGRFFKRV